MINNEIEVCKKKYWDSIDWLLFIYEIYLNILNSKHLGIEWLHVYNIICFFNYPFKKKIFLFKQGLQILMGVRFVTIYLVF